MVLVAAEPIAPDTVAPVWWARALTLAERVSLNPPPPAGRAQGAPAGRAQGAPGDGAERGRRALERWRAAHGLEVSGQFARRLADAGIDADSLVALLAEPPESLARRAGPPPGWAEFVTGALRAADEPPVPDDDLTWSTGFGLVMAPFIDAAAARLRSAVRLSGVDTGVDVSAIVRDLAEGLTATLVRISVRTLLLELNVRRVTGGLAGSTPRQRFAAFARHLAQRAALERLLGEYPVLGRLIGQTCQRAVDSHVELLRRFAADREALVTTLLGGVDPGVLAAIDVLGDAHQGGRCVAVLRFADGSRVVYKPRSLAIHRHFNVLIGWLAGKTADLDLSALAVVERDGYGWVEFAEYRPCHSPDEVTEFYRRMGGLMALLYAIDGTDVHFENLVACGGQPVLVDLETLLQPALPAGRAAMPDPASAALTESVIRISLLPQLIIGEHGASDISGLGGDADGAAPFDVVAWDADGTDEMRVVRRPVAFVGGQNRPVFHGRPVEPAEHLEALLHGFCAGYDAIVEHRGELVGVNGLLVRCADFEIRVVPRATRPYAVLLDESTHPDVMRDALDRDRILDLLWATSVDDPARERLVRHEIADIWAGDIPLFVGRPGELDLWTSRGERLPAVLDKPSLQRVIARVNGMGEVDREAQQWLIRATMAVRGETDGHRFTRARVVAAAGTGRFRTGGTKPEPQRFLNAARGIAERILATGLDGADRVNWLGVEALDGRYWTVRPLGAGLGTGYTGVALYLAQLAVLTGEVRYAEQARHAVRPAEAVLAALAVAPGAPALVGVGGFDGLGGIAYGLARLGVLLDDAGLADAARRAVELVAVATDADQQPGVMDGVAGGLAAMVAVAQQTGLPTAWRAAHHCAERLAVDLRRPDRGAAPAGFAFGDVGVGWALLRFAAAGGGGRYADLGRTALDRGGRAGQSGPDAAVGWCHGAAGIALADSASPATGTASRQDASPLTSLVQRPLPAEHSLCHGVMGAVEALTVAAPHHEVAAAALPAVLVSVLDSVQRVGPTCGTPRGIESPGLLTGLAGIGYGLLRAGFPDDVPSVLLLEPDHERRHDRFT